MNLWIKTHLDEKITRSKTIKNKLPMTKDDFTSTLSEVCHELDLPTPIIGQISFDNVDKFNYLKLKAKDFVEKIDFDFMEIEVFF